MALFFLSLMPSAALPMEAQSSWVSRAWQTDEGLPDNSVTGLAQTRDGFFWVGTLGGLLRFNGTSFTNVLLPRLQGVSHQVVRSVFRDSHDRLWLGMERGRMISLTNGKVQIYGPEHGLPPHMILSFAEDQSGALWLSSQAGISCLSNGKFRHFGQADGLIPSRHTPRVVVQSDGSIAWLFGRKLGVAREGQLVTLYHLSVDASVICAAASSGLWVCEGAAIRRFAQGTMSAEITTLPDGAIPQVLCEDRFGALWIGTTTHGLFRLENDRLENIPTSHSGIDCILEDREGNIWAGTTGGGLNQIRPRIVTLINRQAGLPSEALRSVCEDAAGDVWVVFENGRLARHTDGQWIDAGHNDIEATCVAAHPDGSVWLGTSRRGLHRFANGQWQVWNRSSGLAGNSVRSILVANDGKVWIASEYPRRLQAFHEGRFHHFAMPPGLGQIRSMRAITEAADGTIWVGTACGELMRVEGDTLVLERDPADDTIRSIRSLHANPQGGVWIGYAGSGLGQWKNGVRTRITSEQGLHENHLSQMQIDHKGSIWIAGNRGLSVVRIDDIENVFAGRNHRLRARAFGRAESLPGMRAAFDFSPASVSGRDGRLFFAMRNGLLMVRPDKVRENPLPPPVVIERVTVDDHTAAAYDTILTLPFNAAASILELRSDDPELRLTPRQNKIEFEFAALSFASPENIHFRYQLRGFDQKWIDANTQTRATYPRLPAGKYEFCVIACNHAGVWNETGASIRIVVAPFYWQTWWFRALTLAIFTATLIAIVRYVSFRRLRENMRQLEQQAVLHQERARIARDMHDEVGAKLTRLSLLSEMAAADATLPAETGKDVREISETARETILAFDEIVWAVNPRNDTLADFAGYLCRHAEDFFEGGPTECIFDLPATIPAIPLATETRHELFLAAKEALTNVAKYAAASRVRLRLALQTDAFEVIIEDDGRGFDPSSVTTRPGGGNGLPNMRERMRRIRSRFECISHPGGGTRIKFHIPISR